MKKNIFLFPLVIGILLIVFVIILSNRKQAIPQQEAKELSSQVETKSDVVSSKNTITYKDGVYSPSSITIHQGEILVFLNKSGKAMWPASNIHPTHDIYPAFDPRRPLATDEQWSFVFDKKGIWQYHDHLFPSVRGIVIVE